LLQRHRRNSIWHFLSYKKPKMPSIPLIKLILLKSRATTTHHQLLGLFLKLSAFYYRKKLIGNQLSK